MAEDPHPPGEVEPYAEALADGIEAALPGWVEGRVQRVMVAWTGGGSMDPEVQAAARSAGEQAQADVGARVRALLALDVEEQRTNPLSIIREAVRYPTEVLADAGVPEVVRDQDAERLFPDDPYDLTPGGFADLDPALQEVGVAWGAAKAHVILSRRRG